ncbi:MAG: hypothetical protein R3246_14010, partial [Acidimicrobiia bacterium]|nr:hypothetical protein [Acidimicrobiia bacterium]
MVKPTLEDLRRHARESSKRKSWQTSAFPTSTGGLVRPPYPTFRPGRGTSGGVGDITLGGGNPPIGELLDLTLAGDIGPGGSNVPFTAITRQQGFAGVNVPNSQILLPHRALYTIGGELFYPNGEVDGGVISLYINGSLYNDVRGFNESWNRYPFSEEFTAEAGDFLSIYLNHDGASDINVEGSITLATDEPSAEAVQDTAEFVELNKYSEGDGSITITTLNTDFTLADDDLLVAVVMPSGSSGGDLNCPAPSGWAKHIQQTTTTAGDEVTVAIFSKTVSGTVSSPTFDW